jgi:uncharacterized protein YcgI (DUF1989 family)
MGRQERVEVPPYEARAVRLRAGQDVRIVDVEGAQVGDLWAVAEADRPGGERRWLSVPHVRDVFERLVPRPGDQLPDQTGEPILELLADDSPGRHDLLFPPCDRWLFERAGLPGHRNCRDNFLAVAGERAPFVPEPFNLFMTVDLASDGTLTIRPPATRPGDSTTFRALRDVTVVLSACSVDHTVTNGDRCTGLAIEIGPARGA